MARIDMDNKKPLGGKSIVTLTLLNFNLFVDLASVRLTPLYI